MDAHVPTRTPRRTATGASVARERLLDTALGNAYAHGIHPDGDDRIIGAAGVTRATF